MYVQHAISTLMSPPVKYILKRINVIYYNSNDLEDILVMTTPADP